MLSVRRHGSNGPPVVVLHGGPGAPGSAASLARPLGRWFRVLEPQQRLSGAEPLTVVRHSADLDEVLRLLCPNERPALVGHSWGAMLALAYAAAHPQGVAALALVACGTFDPSARLVLEATRHARMDVELRLALDTLGSAADGQKAALLERLTRLDSYELLPAGDETDEPAFDARGHAETWADMLRLQEAGVYPQAFTAIHAPVLMLHGSFDPHPGRLIRARLAASLPQLEYREWERCGHYPWRERAVREPFFAALKEWLETRLTPPAAP